VAAPVTVTGVSSVPRPFSVTATSARSTGTVHGHADQVDHITPVHLGGSDELENLTSACLPCRSEKTAREAGRASQKRWKREPPIRPGLV
jgi:5-methylcytosine-specific restriction endonuclease McrA